MSESGMSEKSKEAALALVAGLLFGAGLAVAGMTQPEKVIGFLDLFGDWDPSLALVMGGAIAVHFVAYRLIKGRPSPLITTKWSLPTRRDLDLRLVVGAAVFGIGWGLAGICPGPGVVSLLSFAPSAGVFVGAMLVAMWLTAKTEGWLARRRAPAPAQEKGAAGEGARQRVAAGS